VSLPFSFGMETDLTFGVGTRSEVGAVAARFGTRAALVVSRSGFGESPYRGEVEQSLRDADVQVVARVEPTGEPTVREAIDLAQQLRETRADVVVAIGGGSTIDLAKAAAVATVLDVDLHALAGGPRFDGTALPVVAVPTTAGAGAEVSRGAIVLDEVKGLKRGIRGRGVAPRAALVDPALMTSCGPRVTALAGFDAVAHAVETAVSRVSTPITRLLSVEALGQLLTALPAVVDRPDDVKARSASAYGATLMGINLANSSTCLPHRMQYPVGAMTRTQHAAGVAALMPAWLQRTTGLEERPLAVLAPVLARQADAAGPDDAGRAVADAVLALMDRLDLRPRLRDLGVRRDDLPRLAAMVEGTVENDPGPSDRGAILALYEESF
jgi:alcohol dehydrogenase class IV